MRVLVCLGVLTFGLGFSPVPAGAPRCRVRRGVPTSVWALPAWALDLRNAAVLVAPAVTDAELVDASAFSVGAFFGADPAGASARAQLQQMQLNLWMQRYGSKRKVRAGLSVQA